MTESQKRVPGSPYTIEGEEANTERTSSEGVPRHAGDVVEGELGSARLREPSHVEPAPPGSELVGNDPVVDLSEKGA